MTEINIKLLDITSASDGDVLKYVAANGSVEYGAAPGAASINTHTVTVSGGVFYIDSTATPILSFEPGSTYKFDQSDASNASHPLRFSTVSDGTHNSGSEYTTNVTTSGTPGSSGAYTQIVISYSTPTLYYYCSNHSGMGSSSIVGNPDSAANDYSTYTTVTGLINTVQANVTALPDSAANDYSTYTTLSSLVDSTRATLEANDYATYTTVAGLINTVQANVTALPDSAANDYSTYTTLSGLINTVQSNVTALPDSAANDYATYTTLSNLIDGAQATLNANDYATYTTVTGLINTVQSNLTSVIGAAPTTLDTLAEIAAALENDANIAVTLTNAIGTVSANAATNATNIDKVQANLSVLPDSAANDYATYTTLSGLINTVQANVTALPDSAANDYSTYNTLSNLIDTVQDNVVATSNTTNNWVNSNDYSTYITVTANLYNTYTSLVSDINLVQGNVTSLTSTVDSADANLYNTYITVTGLIDTVQSNVTTNTNNINTVQSNLTAITSSDLNDVNTAGVSTGDFLLHDGVQFLPVNFATEVNTYADARISVASIQDLSDVDGIDTPANGDTLVFDGTDFGFVNFNSETNSLFDTRFATKSTTDLAEGTNLYFTDARAVSAVESANLNLGSNNITTTGKILYSNMYATEGDLPSATTYHGMFAHVHGTGKSYFAHGGNWIKLLDETNSTTDNLTEGSTNLYYTDARVNTHLNVSTATSNQVLSWSGSDYTWIDQSTGSSSTWSNVSSNVTAAAGDKLFVDTSANPITITLPASPAFGSEIRVIDIKGTSANNKITLDNNGNNIEGITDSLEVNINRAAFGLVFYDATEGWVFIEK